MVDEEKSTSVDDYEDKIEDLYSIQANKTEEVRKRWNGRKKKELIRGRRSVRIKIGKDE